MRHGCNCRRHRLPSGQTRVKFRDWGKMAATFVDVESGRAIASVLWESSREAARQLHPEIDDRISSRC